MTGRRVDDVSLLAVRDIDAMPDDELYQALPSEFPAHVGEARAAGIVRSG